MTETTLPSAGGFHSILEQDHPYIFVDACMQAWPDADFANAHRHGVTAYAVTAWRPRVDFTDAVEEGMYWHLVARRHKHLVVAEEGVDIRRAKQAGNAALIIAAQGGDWIGSKIHRVEAFQRLGLRIMLLAYNATNLLADGMLDRRGHGLTKFGELVVSECNRVGIVLDGTHTGKRATLQMIDRSALPCIFSHSNPSAVSPNARNIDDEQIRACATRGGVIGLAPWGPLVFKRGMQRRPTVDDFIDHIDHLVQLTGSADHIGIGTDASLGTYPDHWHDPWGEPEYGNPFEEYGRVVSADVRSSARQVEGFADYAEVINFIDRMLARGYAETDIGKVLGENMLRIFDQVWKPAGAVATA